MSSRPGHTTPANREPEHELPPNIATILLDPGDTTPRDDVLLRLTRELGHTPDIVRELPLGDARALGLIPAQQWRGAEGTVLAVARFSG
ncbi:hypothetical protein HNR23_002253 [Nocardiopsis mwathae]|uniref:Uncharacterized protein n=1 Tax=Nocardiopsis mwathae TaxID=1472723 RepID=A0A7W9YHE0_9ACTN|nr:hypothetical protein [Nocardiopsis mwathae]MBB6172193.1 hypothetical protein [Nocardiopsis mwathae]